MAKGDKRPTTPARADRERTALERAESPALTAKIEEELGMKVRVFTNKRGPMALEPGPPDPFSGMYETDYLEAKDDDARGEILKNLSDAHQIDHWLKIRKTERVRIVRLREEAEREYAAQRDAGAKDSVLKIARASVTDLQKRENLLIAGTLRKQEPRTDVVISHALEIEDDRSGVVETVSRNLIIEPPFHPAVLEQLVLNSSSLGQLVSAMEVNVAATGWELVPVDTLKMEEQVEQDMTGMTPEDVETLQLEQTQLREAVEREFQEEIDRQMESLVGFFNEPWPGMSFTTMRRRIRHDEEATGNAFMEILRDASGDIVFARWVDSKLMRLVRLDEPVVVEKTIERGGVQVTIPINLRERRFVEQVGSGAVIPRFEAQGFVGAVGTDPNATASGLDTRRLFTSQGTRIIYFKEFGASRDLDMWTGVWAEPGEEIPMERRATEMIHFGISKDAKTPYFLPRWINNLPSVLGNRKAEEFNLAFFNAGGVPPLLITIAGGQLAERSAKALEERFNTLNPATKHQAVIMEVTPSGMLGKQGKVAVDVHRFGSERMQDALFGKYDEQTRGKLRESFRLAPVFVGDADSHNFNTVKSSYLVAEAQVFQPERDEEDEIFTMKLLRNMPQGDRFRFRSLPLVIDDANDQVKCIEIAANGSFVSGEQIVEALNRVCNLGFRFDKEANDQAREERMSMRMSMAAAFASSEGKEERDDPDAEGSEDSGEIQDNSEASSGSGGGGGSFGKIAKMDEVLDGLVSLGVDLAEAFAGGIQTPDARRKLRKQISLYEGLEDVQKRIVDRTMAMMGLGGDREELMELFGCSAGILATRVGDEPDPE